MRIMCHGFYSLQYLTEAWSIAKLSWLSIRHFIFITVSSDPLEYGQDITCRLIIITHCLPNDSKGLKHSCQGIWHECCFCLWNLHKVMDPSHQGCSLYSFKVADIVSIDSNMSTIHEHKGRKHSNSNNTSHTLVLLGSHMCLLSSRKIWLPNKCRLECNIYRQLNQHKVSQFNVINQNSFKKP